MCLAFLQVRLALRKLRPLSLDRNGFELHRQRSALSDFSDPAKIEAVYYRESEQLLKQVTGARRVVVFGLLVEHLVFDTPERRNA